MEAVATSRSYTTLYPLAGFLIETHRPADALPLLQELASAGAVDVTVALVTCLARLERWDDARGQADALKQSQESRSDVWLSAGRSLVGLAMYPEAEFALKRAVACGDASYLCMYGLGYVVHRQTRWQEALDYYVRASRLKQDPGLLSNIAMCQRRLQRYREAGKTLARVLDLLPDDISTLSQLVEVSAMGCAFDEEALYAARLDTALLGKASVGTVEPHVATYAPLSDEARGRALAMASQRFVAARSNSGVPGEARRRKDGRVRIGYLSSDFCNHAVGRLFAGYVGDHDRRHVHVHAYSLRQSNDLVARAIRARTETVRELCGYSAEAVEDAIRSDGIDLLIDLNGFTDGAMPEVLASRPAPRQLSYLGFIHDHQAPWIDGIVMDSHVAPLPLRSEMKNRILDVPGTMFPPAYHHASELDGCWSREDVGVGSREFLMCSFANAYKIDRRVLRSWVSITRNISRSVLLLYAGDEAGSALEEAWVSMGGARSQLRIVDRMSTPAFIARLRACDLMLDTFRYSGGATSVEAVMQGLPVLTLGGGSPVSRLSASLNHFVGMDELVASSECDYVCRAIRFAEAGGTMKSRFSTAVGRARFADGRRIASAIEQF